MSDLEKLTIEELCMFMRPYEDNTIEYLASQGWEQQSNGYGWWFERRCEHRGRLRIHPPYWHLEACRREYNRGRRDIAHAMKQLLGITATEGT